MVDVVVIGGGVSGLATAHRLVGLGHSVQLLERQVRIGGNATSVRFDGFLMEQGPTTINAAIPEAMDWVDELKLGSCAVGLGAGVIKRYLRDERGMHGISTNPFGFFMSGYLSPKAKMALLSEFFRKTKTDLSDETIHEFVRRRFGQEFADRVIEPLAAGIFMGDSKSLSVNGAFPKLVEMERTHGSITKAILAAKKNSEPGRRLFSWRNGIGVLPQTLADLLGNRVKTGVVVKTIKRNAQGYDVVTGTNGTIKTKAIVLAVQPHVAATLLQGVEPEAATATAEITAPPIAVAFLGYRREQVAHPLDGLGYLSVKSPKFQISGTQFSSTMFAGRAPDGHVAISAYIGGARNADLACAPQAEILDIAQSEMADLLEITGVPVVARAHRWSLGLPQYCLGHAARVEKIRTASRRAPGIFLTGNYLGGVSVSACLKSAGEIADEVSAQLQTNRSDQFQGVAL